MLKAGIVGLPNVGKSTLFNALVANAQAEAANYPFCTIEPNSGVVALPDPRLQQLSDLSRSKEIIPTRVEFVDIAGLVKGASQGEGLGNKFLANIREVDAIVHVVRCFENDDVIHVSGSVGPARDAEVINLELGLSDLAQVEKRRERLVKQVRTSKEAQLEDAALARVRGRDGLGGRGRQELGVEHRGRRVHGLAVPPAVRAPVVRAEAMGAPRHLQERGVRVGAVRGRGRRARRRDPPEVLKELHGPHARTRARNAEQKPHIRT